MEPETELISAETDNKGLLILIANLIILGLMLKLYTEMFKDKAINRRLK